MLRSLDSCEGERTTLSMYEFERREPDVGGDHASGVEYRLSLGMSVMGAETRGLVVWKRGSSVTASSLKTAVSSDMPCDPTPLP